VPLAEDLAQPVGLSQPRGGTEHVADRDRAAEHGGGILAHRVVGEGEPRPDIALRPPRDINPYRSIHATWLRGRRVPAVERMVAYLAEAAQARLGGRA
jgi:DNA-binding transcriptional LysR family regulator